jgi:hypothetical protein
MKNLFLTSTPEGKENIKRFPHLRHHNPRITEKKPMCIKYHCGGKCQVGCPHLHIKPKPMSKETYKKGQRSVQEGLLVT